MTKTDHIITPPPDWTPERMEMCAKGKKGRDWDLLYFDAPMEQPPKDWPWTGFQTHAEGYECFIFAIEDDECGHLCRIPHPIGERGVVADENAPCRGWPVERLKFCSMHQHHYAYTVREVKPVDVDGVWVARTGVELEDRNG